MSPDFSPASGFVGGILIGLAAVLLLVANGRIAGVSGIVGGLLARVSADTGWRVAFVLGHGVCGIARFSPRSMVATLIFMASGIATVFVVRHVI